MEPTSTIHVYMWEVRELENCLPVSCALCMKIVWFTVSHIEKSLYFSTSYSPLWWSFYRSLSLIYWRNIELLLFFAKTCTVITQSCIHANKQVFFFFQCMDPKMLKYIIFKVSLISKVEFTITILTLTENALKLKYSNNS